MTPGASGPTAPPCGWPTGLMTRSTPTSPGAGPGTPLRTSIPCRPPATMTPRGIWSDGATLWVADIGCRQALRLRPGDHGPGLQQGLRYPDGPSATNDPRGLWSDGATMWVADIGDDKLYAYDLATTARVPAKDFETLRSAGNNDPTGDVGLVRRAPATMWVADSAAASAPTTMTPGAGPTGRPCGYLYDKLYLEDKTRVSAKDFDGLIAAGNNDPRGWSDGATMWVADGVDDKIYAYLTGSRAWTPSQDFDTPPATKTPRASGPTAPRYGWRTPLPTSSTPTTWRPRPGSPARYPDRRRQRRPPGPLVRRRHDVGGGHRRRPRLRPGHHGPRPSQGL